VGFAPRPGPPLSPVAPRGVARVRRAHRVGARPAGARGRGHGPGPPPERASRPPGPLDARRGPRLLPRRLAPDEALDERPGADDGAGRGLRAPDGARAACRPRRTPRAGDRPRSLDRRAPPPRLL